MLWLVEMLQEEYKDNMEDYDMKKIKTNNKNQQQKAPMKNSTRIALYSIAGIVLLAIVVLMAIEGKGANIKVSNNTDRKLEYVKAYFVDTQDRVTEDDMLNESLDKGKKLNQKLEKTDLTYRQANLEVRFKFEDSKELFVDAGYFNEIFNGSIKIDFEDIDDDRILLKVKASSGVIASPNISCDEEYVFNLTTGEEEE